VEVTTIVLAAGRGRRLGGPKALLCWPVLPQKWLLPLAAAHVEARPESRRVIVVSRADINEVLRRVAAVSFSPPGRGQLVDSEAEDALGPAGSLAVAAPLVVGGEDDVLLVTPVDCPPARRETVAELIDALVDDPSALVAKPRFEGRGGHPVALRPAALGRYLERDPPPLRDVIRGLGEAVVDVAVDDPTVRIDIDRPDDLLEWSRRFGGGAVDDVAFFRAP
jgi:CTP:molybdopterin cytidylyltransferase MocA